MSKKKNKIKISVGVITYNQAETIQQTLDSILCQQGNFDLEVIIGEDCSPDNTYAICQEYVRKAESGLWKDKSIKLLPHTHNLGIMANFARVMHACTGGYVGILAGDDYWCDDRKLEKQLKFMLANPQFGVCCTSGYRLMVETGRLVPGIEPLKPIVDGDITHFYRDHLSGIYAQPLSLLIRADLLKFVDFDEFVRRKFPFEDLPMQSILAHHTLFGYLPDRTSVYRISSQSATFTSFDNPKFMDYYSGIADMRRYLHSLFPDDIPFSEKWASEYIMHRQLLQYVWLGNYQAAKTLSKEVDPSTVFGKKVLLITKNRLTFYIFMLYKKAKYHRSLKKRTN